MVQIKVAISAITTADMIPLRMLPAQYAVTMPARKYRKKTLPNSIYPIMELSLGSRIYSEMISLANIKPAIKPKSFAVERSDGAIFPDFWEQTREQFRTRQGPEMLPGPQRCFPGEQSSNRKVQGLLPGHFLQGKSFENSEWSSSE
jgi:hypothetical protein